VSVVVIVAGHLGVAGPVRKPRGEERLLLPAQGGVPDDPVEQTALGVREVF